MIRILLADNKIDLRSALRSFLGEVQGYQVVGEADSGPTAISLAKIHRPTIAIVRTPLPGRNGADGEEMIRSIVRDSADTRVIVISSVRDGDSVRRMLYAGASGYVLQSESMMNELADAISVSMHGGKYLSPPIADRLADSVSDESLTHRESQVLLLVAEGKSNKEIADALEISVRTVEMHRHNLRSKIGVQSTAELVQYAIRKGMLTI
jgi:DNA-binding NarL/FixJ family response regulator